jgi:hypothetical protein
MQSSFGSKKPRLIIIDEIDGVAGGQTDKSAIGVLLGRYLVGILYIYIYNASVLI